ncbi:hypothetical protein [Paenibacillus polymyxa]|uniref:hypothetical protein n=1 Tax=Paenibacillus polymyxa TaxID=1406 RepID=UPI002ED0A610|nr:hypothetical protein [Paenibacillus polymyxa]
MEEYTIENNVSTDKKFVKDYLSYTDHNFKFPCKLTVISPTGKKNYLVDKGNLKGHAFLVLDWSRTVS